MNDVNDVNGYEIFKHGECGLLTGKGAISFNFNANPLDQSQQVNTWWFGSDRDN